MAQRLVIPIGGDARPQFDNDHPDYVPGSAATYLLLALCYETLAGPTTVPDRDGITSPNFVTMANRLAREVTQDGDGRWLVRLRPGVTSHWGNELTAEHVRWGLEKAFATGNIGSWRWGQVGGVESPDSVEILDSHTLRYTLRRPDPFFHSRLFWATPSIVDATQISRHASADDPFALAWQATNVSGYGAYAYEGGDAAEANFRSRAQYWAGDPPVPWIVLRRVGGRDEALAQLAERTPAFVPGLRPDEVVALRGRDDVHLVGSWAGHTSIEINHKEPPFDDVRVRQALSVAIPYERILREAFLGLARPWRAPIHTYAAWYEPSFWHYDTDPARARELLGAAGFGTGLRTTLHIPRRPEATRVAEILSSCLSEVGIELEIADLAAHRGGMPPLHLRMDCGHNLSEPLYDLAHDYAPLTPIVPRSQRVGVGTWTPLYAGDPILEEMFREALLAPDIAARRERTLLLQKSIVEFAPAVFLAEQALFNATNDLAHPWLREHQNRLNQVTLYQNANSHYISGVDHAYS